MNPSSLAVGVELEHPVYSRAPVVHFCFHRICVSCGSILISCGAKIIHCQWYAYSTGVNIHKSPVYCLGVRSTNGNVAGADGSLWCDDNGSDVGGGVMAMVDASNGGDSSNVVRLSRE